MPALRLLCTFFFLSIFNNLTAQSHKKNFTNCNNVVKELDSLKNSFDDIINVFKKEVILEDELGIEYSSDYTICEQQGLIERLADRTQFSFTYNDENYLGSSDDYQRRFQHLFKEIKLLFMQTHSPTFRFLAADETLYEFYENGKDGSQSQKIITLLLSKRPGFMKVVLMFINKHREKKAF